MLLGLYLNTKGSTNRILIKTQYSSLDTCSRIFSLGLDHKTKVQSAYNKADGNIGKLHWDPSRRNELVFYKLLIRWGTQSNTTPIMCQIWLTILSVKCHTPQVLLLLESWALWCFTRYIFNHIVIFFVSGFLFFYAIYWLPWINSMTKPGGGLAKGSSSFLFKLCFNATDVQWLEKVKFEFSKTYQCLK